MKIAIVGTGLIGGSLGLAIKHHLPGSTVVAFDRNSETSTLAVARGAADLAATSVSAAVADAEVVFIATPVGAITEVVREAVDSLARGALLTDVGSVKSQVVRQVESVLPEGCTFIGGHPMAGSEEEGIAAATADLFDGAWWILTPTEDSEPEGFRRLHNLLTTLGARVMAVHPAEHDELMALISHLPQLVATTLMNLASERGREHAGLLALAAGGFRDITRVAASNPAIWADICDENSTAIASALRVFARRLETLADQVEHRDRASLIDQLEHARAARRSLPSKDVPGEPHRVRLPIPDRPGVLAEVTTTVGNLGVNIEDIEITHAAEGGRGLVTVTIAGTHETQKVVDALRARGFDAKLLEL